MASRKKQVSKRQFLFIFILLLGGVYSVNIVAADFSDVFTKTVISFFKGDNLITGMLTSGESNVSAAVGNQAPAIEAIDGPGGNSITAQAVTEDSILDLLVTFVINDSNGVGDINLTDVNVTLYNATWISTDVNYYSYNTSCDNTANLTTTQMNVSCTIEVHYWYTSGEWNLTVGGADYTGVFTENATNFTISETTAIVISPDSLTFPSLTLGTENITSDNDPIVVNNTANDYIDQNNTRITGLDLVGESNPEAQAITTGNFTVSESTGETPPVECSNIGDDLNNTRLINNTATPINMSILSAGNRSVSGVGLEQLYICIPNVPESLVAQTYSTANGTTGWTVSVV